MRFISPHSVRNIRNKKCQIFAYFSVLVFTPDNFLEIKLLSIAYNYQSRINISMYVSTESNKVLQLKNRSRHREIICRLLTVKSRSARGGSHHPPFMVSCLTISQTRLPCRPSGQMGLQSQTVAVAINQLSNLEVKHSWQHGGYVVKLPPLKHRFDTPRMSNVPAS